MNDLLTIWQVAITNNDGIQPWGLGRGMVVNPQRWGARGVAKVCKSFKDSGWVLAGLASSLTEPTAGTAPGCGSQACPWLAQASIQPLG